MKRRLYQAPLLILVLLYSIVKSQTILIRDTIYNPRFPSSDSSFSIEGNISGFDSGSLRLNIKNVNYSIPIKAGRFYIYGIANTIQKAEYMIGGDYYLNSFFIEPGKIKIECDLINRKYRTSGTKENDAQNYFNDSLIYNLESKIHDLNIRAEAHMESQNINAYLNTIDSFPIIQKGFISAIEQAIDRKLFGYYLLDAINLYPIRYKLFQEREILFNKLPDFLRLSEKGKESYGYLKKLEIDNQQKNTYTSPQFLLHDNLGKMFNLSKYYGKKIIVLDFWASWCSPCIKALPMIKKIQQLSISRNVQFVSISIDKNKDDWIKMEKKIKIPWTSVITDSISTKRYNIKAIPAYFIIDKQQTMKSVGSSISDLYYSIKNASYNQK